MPVQLSDELRERIKSLVQSAKSSNARDSVRADLLDRYLGEPDPELPEFEGRSKFRSTDVSDVISTIHAEIMDIFTGSDQLVRFRPTSPDDADQARIEVEAVRHVFWRRNPGYEVLSTWTLEALIGQVAYVRHGWEKRHEVEVEDFEDLLAEEVRQIEVSLAADLAGGRVSDVELDVEPVEGSEDPETGKPTRFNVQLRAVHAEDVLVVRNVPQEELVISEDWTRVSLDGCPFVAHRRELRVSELVAMGFARDQFENVDDEDEEDTSVEELARENTDFYQEDELGEDAVRGITSPEVTVMEMWVRADWNDDGIDELLHVWATGRGEILRWEDGSEAVDEATFVPIVAMTPRIVPHRHVGQSIAELIVPIQRVNTVLIRHTLDNVYLTNYARPAFDETLAGKHLISDLGRAEPGAPIRTGGAQIEWLRPPPVIDSTLPLIELFQSLREERSGATRYNQGLDADSLNKTATGVARIMSAAQKRIKAIARTMAETGLADLFRGLHRELRSGPWRELAFEVGGEWQTVDPRQWKRRHDVIVDIGGGSAERAEQLAIMDKIIDRQAQALAAGVPIVTPENLYEAAIEFMRKAGFRDAERFFVRPSALPPAPQQPDPAQALAEAQIAQVQADAQAKAAEVEIKRMEAERKAEIERAKLDAELEIKAQELAIKERELELKARELELKAREAEAREAEAISKVAEQTSAQAEKLEGGDLGSDQGMTDGTA